MRLMGKDELEFAFELADLGGGRAAERFRAGGWASEDKPDGSPVTEVDREVEQLMRAQIERERPDHAIVGEEFGGDGDGEWCWYLDPIDGTASFIAGAEYWMTLVALAHRGEVVLGVVDYPMLGQRWWAQRGRGAFCNGQPVHVSPTAELSRAAITDDWRGTLAMGDREHPLSQLALHVGAVRERHGHAFLGVASGLIDLAINVGGHPWDFAPFKVIIEEAGGRLTDLQGRPRIDQRAALVSNGVLHEAALAVI